MVDSIWIKDQEKNVLLVHARICSSFGLVALAEHFGKKEVSNFLSGIFRLILLPLLLKNVTN